MNDRIRHATQRLSSIVHEHGDASAMVGAGALALVVILVGAAVLRSNSSEPTVDTAPESTARPISPAPSFAAIAPSPLPVAPTSAPSHGDGYLEVPDLDPIDVEDPDPVVPTPTPEPTPRPKPSIALLLDGTGRQAVRISSGDSVDAILGLRTANLDRS